MSNNSNNPRRVNVTENSNKLLQRIHATSRNGLKHCKEANIKRKFRKCQFFQKTSSLPRSPNIQTRYSATTRKGHSNRKIKETQ